MRLRCNKGLAGAIATGLLLAFAVSAVPTGPVWAKDLYATAISGGKTKPIVDIDNMVPAPKKVQAIKEPTTGPQKRSDTAASQVVEDAAKYRLYIDPVYPRGARLANKEATVELQLTFDKTGKMRDALVRSCTSPGWGFEQSALAASLESVLSGHGDREITVKTIIKFKLD